MPTLGSSNTRRSRCSQDQLPALQVRQLSKAFAAPVLRGIDLEIACGEVHALLGANGAGKTTLARIVSGLLVPDAGEMVLGGKQYTPANKLEAETAGVQMVMQELSLLSTVRRRKHVL